MNRDRKPISISDYLRFRAETRGFDIATIEEILRYSEERYLDTDTGRLVVIGRDQSKGLMLVAYEATESELRPVTVHATTRQQISFRVATGRYTYE